MNDNFRELKERIRTLDALLAEGGSPDLSFAQAVSALRRAVKHGDRTRPLAGAPRAAREGRVPRQEQDAVDVLTVARLGRHGRRR